MSGAAGIFELIGQSGENIGNTLEQSNDPTVSEIGSQTSTMFNPAQAATDASSSGDYWGALSASLGIAPELFKGKNKNNLPLTDPAQVDYLAALKRKQRALDTGTMYQPQQDLIRGAGAKAQSNLLKLTGGDIGASVAGVNAVNRSTGRNLNELFGEMGLEGLKMNDMVGSLIDKIAQRKLEIQAYQKGQQMVSSAQTKQDLMQSAMALAARNKGFGDWLNKLFASNTDVSDSSVKGIGEPFGMGSSSLGDQTTGWNSGVDLSLSGFDDTLTPQ